MLHKEFWGLLFLVFVGWVFLAGTPEGRIQNVCRPISWTGNVVVSLSALVVPDQQVRLQGYFDKFEYSCRYLNWRLFYQDDYNKWLEQNGVNSSALGRPDFGAAQKKAEPVEPEASKDTKAEDSSKIGAETE